GSVINWRGSRPVRGVLATSAPPWHTATCTTQRDRIGQPRECLMPTGTTAYLVVRRDDGFGDVFPLDPAQSYTLGRATTNAIVLRDALCSGDPAEVSFTAARWRARDLSSLNGTRVNGLRIEGERALSPRDEIHLGRTHLVFVEDMDELPELPQQQGDDEAAG